VQNHHPDHLVIMTISYNTSSKGFIFYSNSFEAEVQVDFVDPATLQVIVSKTLHSEFFKAKAASKGLPAEMKDQLVQQLAQAFPALPY
jgi:hypothetical protein